MRVYFQAQSKRYILNTNTINYMSQNALPQSSAYAQGSYEQCLNFLGAKSPSSPFPLGPESQGDQTIEEQVKTLEEMLNYKKRLIQELHQETEVSRIKFPPKAHFFDQFQISSN